MKRKPAMKRKAPLIRKKHAVSANRASRTSCGVSGKICRRNITNIFSKAAARSNSDVSRAADDGRSVPQVTSRLRGMGMSPIVQCRLEQRRYPAQAGGSHKDGAVRKADR